MTSELVCWHTKVQQQVLAVFGGSTRDFTGLLVIPACRVFFASTGG